MLMHDWDLMLSELFLFHRKENRGLIVEGGIAFCMDAMFLAELGLS